MKSFVFALVVLLGVQIQAGELVDKLQETSVTIKAAGGQGSGVLFNRVRDGEVHTFVWTAAHVVDSLRKVRTVVINGSPKVLVEFEDAQIVQEFKQNGRRIGEIKMDARVVRYSDADQGEDLALLRIRKTNFKPEEVSTQFYLEADIPEIGTPLCHVGSLLGQVGANSYTEGVMSQIGRVLDLGANGKTFDQSTCTAFPGSSGGGVFIRNDGRYIGMLVRGAGEGFNLIVPARRMQEWAKSADVMWAIDPNVPLPSEADLKKLPVEDNGVEFKSESKDAKAYPVLMLQKSGV